MQETKQIYLYDLSFVTVIYSHRDEKFAQKLEADLERYRPPNGIITGRRLSIFRDVQDLVELN